MTRIHTTAYVGEVDVDVDLDDIDTKDLIRELANRGEEPPRHAMLQIRDCLMRNRPNEALALLDTILFPRFHSPDHAKAIYQQTMDQKKDAHP